MDNPLATANARTTSVIPIPSLLLGTTGGTQCHGRPKRSKSADWTVPGGRTWENTQIYEGTNQIQRVVMAKKLLG
jgi:alkylation response protein AidB-like acyl-CoA dehydrogenase